MKLVVFNGSPRKKKSNSAILTDHFLLGYQKHITAPVVTHYLANRKKIDEQLHAFEEATVVLVIFPLYTDAMPGQVMAFIEDLKQVNTANKKIGFIVQSGFPEAYHSTFIERYLKKLALKLECEYLGTVIKGGVEGIQIMPASMTRKLFTHFHDLGSYFAINQSFEPNIVAKLRTPYRMNASRRFVMKLMGWTGLANFYWNKKLKENNAFERRFAQPYA